MRMRLPRSSGAVRFAERKYRAGAGEGNRTLVCSLGSCRSAIELRPQIKDLGGVGLALWLPFRCHVRGSNPASRRFISFETPPSNRLGIDDNETMSTVRAPSISITAPYPMAMALLGQFLDRKSV